MSFLSYAVATSGNSFLYSFLSGRADGQDFFANQSDCQYSRPAPAGRSPVRYSHMLARLCIRRTPFYGNPGTFASSHTLKLSNSTRPARPRSRKLPLRKASS